jgi:high-affinity iron transporter
MLPSFLLSLREGLEAALIISIVLGALGRLNRSDLKPVVWRGAALAVALSLLVGIGLNLLGMEFEGQAEEIFEGIAMLLAAGILTWMIFWMQRHGREIKRHLEDRTRQAALGTKANALFFLAFLAVFREGVELALFLLATSLASGLSGTLAGATLGIGLASGLGWMLFTTTRRLSVRNFFQVTSVLLIFFAAGLVGLGVHELNEAGWIPAVIEHVYDINFLLDESSQLGQILKALFGYNGNPSLTEIIAYAGYFITLGWVTMRNQRSQAQAEAQPA